MTPPSETPPVRYMTDKMSNDPKSRQWSTRLGHSVTMKMHSDNGACDSDDPRAKGVENTVYYPARPLPKPAPVENFSFSSDRARFMMVLRWMVFYKYIPGNTAELESQRAELKRHLGFSSPEYGAKLGWFLNRQFRTFKERGLVSQKKDRQPATYLREAEKWLSEDWDGQIRYEEAKQGAAQTSNVMTTTTTSGKGPRKSIMKRPALGELTSGGKRPKTHSDSSEARGRLTDAVVHTYSYERPGVLTNDANALPISAAVENQNAAGAAAQLRLQSSTNRSIVEQHSATVPAAVELSTDHSDLGESTALINAGPQAPLAEDQTSSPQVAKPVNPTLVMTIDRQSTFTEATRDRSLDYGVVATADSVQQAINATAEHECSPAQLPYVHSPYTSQAGSRPIAIASRGAEPHLDRDNSIQEHVLGRSADTVAAEIHRRTSIAQPTNQVVDPKQQCLPSVSEQQVVYGEAALLKDCFVVYLFRDGLNRGEYRQCDGLVNQYDCGWSDGYLANFRPSEMLDSAYIQAQRELSDPESPLKSRQYFEEFLTRWRSRRSEGQALSTLLPMLPLQAQATIQLQCVPLIPDLQNRGQYEEWCQELDGFKKEHSRNLLNRQILEDAILQIKTSIEELEVLSSLAKSATEDQQHTIRQLKEEMKRSKEQELQVLVSELQSLLKAIQGKEVLIKDLEEKKRLYVCQAKSRLGDLEAMVDYVRHLPEL